MDKEFLDFIESQICNGGIGTVEFEPQKPISDFQTMVSWINTNLKATGIVSKKRLKYFWTSLNPEIINKTRCYFLSPNDFTRLKFKVVNKGQVHYTPYAIIAGINTFSDDFVHTGEFYYCTAEELMIVKEAAK